ncbi:MAG: serine/threonine protein kinase [Candidatus Didemnitutus sp.]|nr:serine/threonine protein kinase [Candidatus Didemnitutus sp.]
MLNRERQIFDEALELPAAARADFLAHACNDDRALRARVESLLEAADTAGGFLGGDESDVGEQIGTRIGPYVLVEKIGEGGFGVVYRAEQEQPMRRSVALKILKLGMDTRAVVARFEAERQALALMNHPNIARVFDGGATPAGRPYFVMELVSGRPITTFCREERLGLRARLGIFLQVCRAVQHAHQKGIIHRDLKPSNMLVGREGDHFTTKVIDFGIAKAARADGDPRTQYTRLNLFVGTPDYMSPEQLDGATGDVDTRSDVFALGAVLYDLLVGVPPFDVRLNWDGSTPPMQRLLRRPDPLAPSQRLRAFDVTERDRRAAERGQTAARLAADLKGDLDQIVLKCLESDRNRRYDSAEDLARDVENYLRDEPVTARPATLRYRCRKFVRRNTAAVAVTSAAVLVLAGVVGFYTFRLARERNLAQRASKRSAAVSELLMLQLGANDPQKIFGPKERDEAIANVQRDFADDPAMQVEILGTTARTIMRGGKRSEAETLLQRALLASRDLPAPTPALARALGDMAIIYRERGDFMRAIVCLERSLKVDHELGPVDGLDSLANTYMELGRNYMALEQVEHAEVNFRRALELRHVQYGAEHGQISTVLGDIADVEWHLGKLAEADRDLRLASDMFRRLVTAEHPNIASSYVAIGRVRLDMGDFASAEKYFNDAIVLDTRLLGPKDWRVASARGRLGATWCREGRLDDAERELRTALAIMSEDPTNNPTHIAVTQLELARVLLLRGGMAAEAEKLLRSALEIQRRRYPPEGWRVASTKSLLAEALLQQRRWAEAEPLLLAAHAILPDIAGPRGWETKATRERLARLYEATGETEKARLYRPSSP